MARRRRRRNIRTFALVVVLVAFGGTGYWYLWGERVDVPAPSADPGQAPLTSDRPENGPLDGGPYADVPERGDSPESNGKSLKQDLEHGHLIYELPLVLAEHGLDELVVKKLGIECGPADLSDWAAVVERLRNPAHETEIAVVGKYITLRDAYKSIYEALAHGGIANDCRVNVRMVESQDVETQGAEACLAGVHGVLVPGGFGYRGIEGKVQAVRYARESRIPYFGICLGMQCAVIDFARNVCGFEGANSSEFDEQTPHPVIDLMEAQKSIDGLGGTMRLGCYACELTPGTRARAAYGVSRMEERHRHRYEYNNAYREKMRAKGMIFAGVSPDGHLVEIAEIADHPWFVTVQFHPEFQSKPDKPHPLFRDFVAHALEHGAAAPIPTTDTATA